MSSCRVLKADTVTIARKELPPLQAAFCFPVFFCHFLGCGIPGPHCCLGVALSLPAGQRDLLLVALTHLAYLQRDRDGALLQMAGDLPKKLALAVKVRRRQGLRKLQEVDFEA